MIETTCEIGDKTSVESSYFIASSGIKTVGYFARAVRAHWGVESMHWTLDVTYCEDACRVRKDHAERNLAAVRKIVLTLFHKNTLFADRSLRRGRVLANRKSAYREKLLEIHYRSANPSNSKKKKSENDVFVSDCRRGVHSPKLCVTMRHANCNLQPERRRRENHHDAQPRRFHCPKWR